MSTEPPAGVAAEAQPGPPRRGMLPIIALVAALAPLNSATVLVALPALAAGLRVEPSQATWAVSIYLVATTVFLPFAGPVADRFGRRRVVLVALGGLGLSSLGAAVSTDLVQLVFARLLQALCAASTVPAAMALVREHIPLATRARAFGVVAAASNASGVIAPLIGAGLLALYGWRSIFAFNVPLAAVVVIIAAAVLPGDGDRKTERRAGAAAWLPRFGLLTKHDVAVSSARSSSTRCRCIPSSS